MIDESDKVRLHSGQSLRFKGETLAQHLLLLCQHSSLRRTPQRLPNSTTNQQIISGLSFQLWVTRKRTLPLSLKLQVVLPNHADSPTIKARCLCTVLRPYGNRVKNRTWRRIFLSGATYAVKRGPAGLLFTWLAARGICIDNDFQRWLKAAHYMLGCMTSTLKSSMVHSFYGALTGKAPTTTLNVVKLTQLG